MLGGEARQAALLASMKAHSEAIYRNTIKAIS